MSLEETIRAYALLNAVKYKGKANPNAVLGQKSSQNVGFIIYTVAVNQSSFLRTKIT